MDFAELIAECCRCALRLPTVQGLVVKVAEGAAKKVGESAFTAIKHHFTLDPDEVGKAIQQSYADALGILMLVSASPSFWEKLKNQFIQSKQTKVMIQRTYEQFTLEFIKEQQLDELAIEKLGNQMRAYCQALVKKKELLLPAEQFSEPNPGLIR